LLVAVAEVEVKPTLPETDLVAEVQVDYCLTLHTPSQ
jgi:hypothetical protein